MSGVVLCRDEDIGEGQARGFLIGEGASRRDVILVRCDGAVRAYVNSCSHQGTPLETFPDKFLDDTGRLLICSTHGARFRVEDGVCVRGPCQGKALARLACEVRDGMIVLIE